MVTEPSADAGLPWQFPSDGATACFDENFDFNNNNIHLVPLDDNLKGECLEDLDDIEISYSTLVKDELRMAIKARRQSKGLPDVTPDFAAQEHDELTEDDKERRRIRRERNKKAAEKCRKKRKEKEHRIVTEHHSQEALNKQLLQEVETLKRERDYLTALLSRHEKACTRTDLMLPNGGHTYQASR
ncbi:basic leucine zipper transcriptional factor ATF-like isoform X1 [Ptychodera flava]